MTPLDVVTVALFVVPAVHAVIRRFQDRFEAFSIHMGLFLISGWVLGAGAAGWATWLALPVAAIAAGISQYVYMRDKRSSRSH